MYMALISRQGSPRSRLILHHFPEQLACNGSRNLSPSSAQAEQSTYIYIYIYVTNACLKTTQLGQFPAVYEQGV